MSSDNKIRAVSSELAGLAATMIDRVKKGHDCLELLEKCLIDSVVNPETKEVTRDYEYLLSVTKYFNQTTRSETATVWDLVLKLKEIESKVGKPEEELDPFYKYKKPDVVVIDTETKLNKSTENQNISVDQVTPEVDMILDADVETIMNATPEEREALRRVLEI